MQRWLLLAALLALSPAAPALAQIEIDQLDEADLYEDEFTATHEKDIPDPFEGFNRVMFKFNDGVYLKVFKPVSRVYRNAMPDPAEKSIGNFFRNLKYPSRLAGNLLQAKFRGAAHETGRFLVNSTVGIGGLFDPARKIEGLEPSSEDIGQALGKWGVGHGFYLVLPVMGPSSLRDLGGQIVDELAETDPWPFEEIYSDRGRNLILRGTEVTNNLPGLIDLYESLVRQSIDPYAALRDGYAQRRAALISE